MLIFVISRHSSSPLSAADFTEFFLALSKRFAAFANCMPQFRALSSEDRDSLLISNTPLYLQGRPSSIRTGNRNVAVFCQKKVDCRRKRKKKANRSTIVTQKVNDKPLSWWKIQGKSKVNGKSNIGQEKKESQP